jgi:hypothetical protein
MIDVDVGQKKVVGSLDMVPPKLADQMRAGGERPGIDRKGEALRLVEPGADELAKAFEARPIEIDAELVFHGASLESGLGAVAGEIRGQGKAPFQSVYPRKIKQSEER